MPIIKFKPIERWPQQPTRNRQRARFDSTYSATLTLLRGELDKLNAKDVFVHLWLDWGQIKNDGTPYGNARPTQPGVIVSFTGKHGTAQMPCDTFTTWQDNLRAIALSLEALRKVDRYGCAAKGQQYTGWLALPAVSEADNAAQFAAVLSRHAGVAVDLILAQRGVFDEAVTKAIHATHPDKPGGEAGAFREVIKARDGIRAFKGWS